jgi:DNA polymerase-3 subunit delta'
VSIFDVQHQQRAHRVIQQALASQRMPHAYLFAGPDGVGREMLAGRLACLLLCDSPVRSPLPEELAGTTADGHGLDACGRCADCRLVQAGTHPDLHLIYRQLNRQHPDSTVRKQKALFLGVDVIRHFVVDRAGTRPMRGRAKVFIIREAERLNDSAQNALLKTLEEPPPDTFLILVTAGLDRMLPTTRSRCQQVHFRTLPVDYVTERLRELRPEAPTEAIEYLARHSEGSLGLSLQMLDDDLYPLKRAWGERLLELVAGGRGFAAHALAAPFHTHARQLAERVSERDPDVSDTDAARNGLQTLLGVLGDFYLDALRLKVGFASCPVNTDQPEVIERLAAGSPVSLSTALRRLADADASLGRNAGIELVLETLFITLSTAARTP